MTELFSSGLIVDLILLGVVAEAIALMIYRFHTGRGIRPFDLLINLLAGACLLMALRSALTDSSWNWTAAWLAAALAAHLADLAQRWQR